MKRVLQISQQESHLKPVNMAPVYPQVYIAVGVFSPRA